MRNKRVFEDWLDNIDIDADDAGLVSGEGDEYETPSAD